MAQRPVLPFLLQLIGAEASGEYGKLQTAFSAIQTIGGLVSGGCHKVPHAVECLKLPRVHPVSTAASQLQSNTLGIHFLSVYML